jgi:DNA-binding NtrC family response regulator
LGLFLDSRIRIEGADMVFDLERSSLRIGLERIDECIREANEACGYVADESEHSPPAETILVVDDQPSVREVAATILRMEGLAVLDTGDPREALGIVQARSIGLLVTDVVMPVMNGCELAERVRSFSPQTRVLFMSAYSSSLVPPGSHFIAKPFSLDSLVATVKKVLAQRSPFSRPDQLDQRPRAGAPVGG